MVSLPTVWAVGHSNHVPETLVALARRHQIAYLIDVRSYSCSRFVSHFNREELKATMEANGIRYAFLGLALGGRPHREAQLDAKGHALRQDGPGRGLQSSDRPGPPRGVPAPSRAAVRLR
jgi:hypothetical protein